MLRRSLDDAERLSRDTKKDWAHLRSQNMALEEKLVSAWKYRHTVGSHFIFLCSSSSLFGF